MRAVWKNAITVVAIVAIAQATLLLMERALGISLSQWFSAVLREDAMVSKTTADFLGVTLQSLVLLGLPAVAATAFFRKPALLCTLGFSIFPVVWFWHQQPTCYCVKADPPGFVRAKGSEFIRPGEERLKALDLWIEAVCLGPMGTQIQVASRVWPNQEGADLEAADRSYVIDDRGTRYDTTHEAGSSRRDLRRNEVYRFWLDFPRIDHQPLFLYFGHPQFPDFRIAIDYPCRKQVHPGDL